MNPRPSRLERIAFRTIGWKLGPRYHGWIVEDVRSGRALRWRAVMVGTSIVLVNGLVRLAIMRRAGDALLVPWVILAPAVGVVGGLAFLLSSATRTNRRMEIALREQGLDPDGRPMASPKGAGRLTNHDVAAIQVLVVAFLAVALGLLPRWIEPVPAGRCLTPSAAAAAPLQRVLRAGVRVEHLRMYKGDYGTAYSGVVRVDRRSAPAAALTDGAIAEWILADDLPPFPMNDAARSAAPSLGQTTPASDRPAFVDRSAECARDAAANGTGRTISAPVVPATGSTEG
ncbi:MAG TPA: hypothetical protein VF230_10355 [Acidimicrobiales bacterium]